MELFNNTLKEPVVSRVGGKSGELPHFVSDYQRLLFTYVNNVVLAGAVSLLGSVANVINLVIFRKNGLNTTINISFFALAISDLCGLMMQQWYSICATPALDNSGIPMLFSDILYFTAGVPRAAFSRITCLITVYVTAERCLCIAFPLKVKQMITPKTAASTLVSIYLITWISAAPLYCTSAIGWKYIPERNRTLLGIIIANDTDAAESAIYIIHALFGALAFFAVILFTSVLIRKLGQKSAWRKTANLSQDTSGAASNRERKTVAMIVLIASVLIICYTPAVLLCAITFYEPEFNTGGSYYNEYQILWSFAFLFEAINSSVNIFVYLKMSTKYRLTFQEIFSRCRVGGK